MQRKKPAVEPVQGTETQTETDGNEGTESKKKSEEPVKITLPSSSVQSKNSSPSKTANIKNTALTPLIMEKIPANLKNRMTLDIGEENNGLVLVNFLVDTFPLKGQQSRWIKDEESKSWREELPVNFAALQFSKPEALLTNEQLKLKIDDELKLQHPQASIVSMQDPAWKLEDDRITLQLVKDFSVAIPQDGKSPVFEVWTIDLTQGNILKKRPASRHGNVETLGIPLKENDP